MRSICFQICLCHRTVISAFHLLPRLQVNVNLLKPASIRAHCMAASCINIAAVLYDCKSVVRELNIYRTKSTFFPTLWYHLKAIYIYYSASPGLLFPRNSCFTSNRSTSNLKARSDDTPLLVANWIPWAVSSGFEAQHVPGSNVKQERFSQIFLPFSYFQTWLILSTNCGWSGLSKLKTKKRWKELEMFL